MSPVDESSATLEEGKLVAAPGLRHLSRFVTWSLRKPRANNIGVGLLAQLFSREWQVLIEQKNLHRLKLQASCLDELEHMVIR